jgi:putative ABC transport system ATP-binding protein
MGERQRVMIARALSTGPRLLLADEPTGSLDTQRGREVLELLRGICREREVAAVIVSHDPMAAEYADRVLSLRDGKLSSSTPSASPPMVEKALGTDRRAMSVDAGKP